MKFPDKLTPTGKPEQYETGETTDRFQVIAETRQEAYAVQAALANVALMVLQSEAALDAEDAKVLLDFMRTNQHRSPRLAVYPEQAERLAQLIRQGATSMMPEVLKNQFDTRDDAKIDEINDEELTRVAIDIASSMSQEAGIRKDILGFRSELSGISPDDF